MKATSTATRAGPRRKRRLLQRRSQELRFLAEYHLWAALQWPFKFVFRAPEQRKGKLAEELASKGIEL
jgi:hypothetical protein